MGSYYPRSQNYFQEKDQVTHAVSYTVKTYVQSNSLDFLVI